MPVIFESFDSYPDSETLRTDLDKLYGKTLNTHITSLCQRAGMRLYCGKFNGRWVTAALVSETQTTTQTSIHISHICVREATRRRGVGSQLMETIINAEYAGAENQLILTASIDDTLSSEEQRVAEAFLSALAFKPEAEQARGPRQFIYQPDISA